MKPIIQHHPLQQLISGDTLHITSYHFDSEKPGPSVYLQANIHGSEIFGSVLLLKLIRFFETYALMQGSVTIVPQANPISVQSQTNGTISGRWNEQTGNNWNRIFSRECVEAGKVPAMNIEQTLAFLLTSLASDHSHVLDIHTSGKDSVNHLYTHAEAVEIYSSLNPFCTIVYTEKDYCNAFDESQWLIGKEKGQSVFAATWEASSHGSLDPDELEKRFEDLLNFFALIGLIDQVVSTIGNVHLSNMSHIKKLHAPGAGYLVWKCKTGERIDAGDVYAELYQSWNGEKKDVRAGKSFTLLSRNSLQAVSEGQEIGKAIIW